MQLSLHVSLFRQFMAIGFSFIFFALSATLGGITLQAMVEGVFGELPLIEAFLKAINMAVVALATFELGLVVNKEYGGKEEDGHIVVVLRRTLPRFVSIVCIALVLEGLLMVIKYSQLDLAGNLYYPVAIISSAAFLLMSLGVFLKLSGTSADEEHMPQYESQTDREVSHRKATDAHQQPSIIVV